MKPYVRLKLTKTVLWFALVMAGIWAMALTMPGCATFKAAQADIPGAVGIGLNVTACVSEAFLHQQDAIGREDAIYACVAAALSQLTEAQKRELLALPATASKP